MANYVTKACGAENTFSAWIRPKFQLSHGIEGIGYLNLDISGTWVGTVQVQRRYANGAHPDDLTYSDPYDVTDGAFTDNASKLISDPCTTVQYRIGIPTGSYTSGTANVRLTA